MDETIAVIGGGPAGLMAAEVLSRAGRAVTVYERMPSPGRKFLMAGRGGLNLTHSEDFRAFVGRYGPAAEHLRPLLEAFAPADLTAWAEDLGQPTFVGSSGRVFPRSLKASPLLRAWLARLDRQGVSFRTRMDWRGWNAAGDLVFAGGETARPAATVLALGGASWARLGSDGAWAQTLAAQGVALAPFEPANVGFTVDWSPMFRERFAGQPLKAIALSHGRRTLRGEAVVAEYGIEGGAVYALSADLRAAIAQAGSATVEIDLRPGLSHEQLAARLDRPRDAQSTATFLRKAANLSPLEISLLREAHGVALPADLASAIKRVPIRLTGTQGLARAISTAGGVRFDAVDEDLMLKARPGVYVAGEMLDWEAPTGGYLLQACFATGVAAARAILAKPPGGE
ncbi:TIGR03862 family flavoprotein [Phenylobacterium sp.]|uniref:NAD(P)/FAD-dependent oxidoreductase n=1 Tax=Phenylobacterium sp. TaxID=1871053 RepID=UPI00271A6B60|nr:TIGR03862 family flavoprotein [Phenylobacterium sp.]MDO8380402.1 TIGR03862 family flavoprotein [Phenylobacterium sp.]